MQSDKGKQSRRSSLSPHGKTSRRSSPSSPARGKQARRSHAGEGLAQAKGAPTPGNKDVGKDDRDSLDVLSESDKKVAQSAAGLEQYIALDRPDIGYAVKTALQGMANPNKLMMLRVVRIARYLKANPRLIWHYRYQSVPKTCDTYGDTDFAAKEAQLRSTTGTCDTFGDHTLETCSSTQSVRVLSTGEAEFYAIVKSAASCLHTQAILLGFGIIVEAQVRSDATAGIGIASRHGSGRVKQRKVIDEQILLKKHGTEIGTKYLLGLLAMTLVREADASVWVVATASVTSGAWLSQCVVVLLLCAVIAVLVWLLRKTPAASLQTAATAAPTAAAPTADTPTTTRTAEASPAMFRERRAAAPARTQSAKFLEFMVGDELRLLLRSRRLRTDGNVQMLGERLASHVAAPRLAGHGEFLKFMTCDEMKVLLRSRGLRVNGLKEDLSERLATHAAV
jgi:hypothetical protein